MKRLLWANFFHIYQPPDWNRGVIRKVVRECYQPLFHQLKRSPALRLTLNFSASLGEQLLALGYDSILKGLRQMVKRGQLELTASVKYHPLLPLIPKSEFLRQLALNNAFHEQAIGPSYRPRGFYLPEMAYSPSVGRLVAQLGYSWLALDEVSLTGQLGAVNFQRGYKLKRTALKIAFRNRTTSDLFFMDFLKSPEVFFSILKQDPRIKDTLLTAFDGENLGHHNHKLLNVWLSIVRSRRYQLVTVSELLSFYRRFLSVEPVPSSWASRESELKAGLPYYLWHNKHNSIHLRQWQLTKLVLAAFSATSQSQAEQTGARQLLDKSLASDQYWWASASPWWNIEIVAASAKKLVLVLRLLKCPAATLRRGLRLAREIASLARHWQRTGRVRRIKQAYLETESFTRFFGGKTVT